MDAKVEARFLHLGVDLFVDVLVRLNFLLSLGLICKVSALVGNGIFS